MSRKCLTDHTLMLRPANFGFNAETAESNAFQDETTNLTAKEIKAKEKRNLIIL